MTALTGAGAGAGAGAGGGANSGTELADLFQACYLDLVRLAAQLVDTAAAAEDVVQDVFAAVQRRGKTLDDPIPYLRTAVLNRSRSVLRRRRVASLFRPLDTALAEPADKTTLAGVERARVLAAIRTLPGRQREIVVLRFYEDRSVPEVALLLGISSGAVSSSAARAMTALKKSLGDRNV